MSEHQFLPDRPAPKSQVGLVGWLRKNLFSTWYNSLFTLVVLYILIPALYHFIMWGFVDASWVGVDRNACTVGGGACWVFIEDRFPQLIYGFYPHAERWRPDLVYFFAAVLVGWLAWPKAPKKIWVGAITIFIYPIVSLILLNGGIFGMPSVETTKWGGLLVTLVLALSGIVISLPFGTVLALGRRSSMPVIKTISTVYIEFWRAVPLITVLFMASVMLPLFTSGDIGIDKLLRAMIGITMFYSAYMAEVVRGGLQAIPKGQYEAAESLGLSYWKSMIFVILPQALKITIPSIVNTFISLFKDTSLVLIIGIFDLLAIGQSALSDPNWLGFSVEMYVFIAFVFWIFCFGISRYSIYIENKLHTGYRN